MSPSDEGEPTRLKTLKVQIPVAYHVRLHSLKVLTGRSISDTVTEAVGRYLHGEGRRGHLGDLEHGKGRGDR